MSEPVSARASGRRDTRPSSQEPARHNTGRVAASLERLAEHLAGAATAVRDLSRDLEDALADVGDPRLMDAMPTTTPGPELLTADDLAARLRITPKTVRRWRTEGRLPEPIEIAGVLRWRAVTFEQWLEERGA